MRMIHPVAGRQAGHVRGKQRIAQRYSAERLAGGGAQAASAQVEHLPDITSV